MRIAHALLLGSLLVVGCERNDSSAPVAQPAAPAEQIERETARLNEWFNARYEEQLDFSPLTKTRLGRKDDYDRIDDFSESGQDAQLEWRRQTVRDLEREFDRAQLTAEGRTSYDLWVYALQRAENALPFRRRGYVFHQMDGVHTGLPQQLITLHRVDDESDLVAYIARIGEVARAVDQQLERARLAADEGVHAPRFAYEAVIATSTSRRHGRAVRRCGRLATLRRCASQDRGAGRERQDHGGARRRAACRCGNRTDRAPQTGVRRPDRVGRNRPREHRRGRDRGLEAAGRTGVLRGTLGRDDDDRDDGRRDP